MRLENIEQGSLKHEFKLSQNIMVGTVHIFRSVPGGEEDVTPRLSPPFRTPVSRLQRHLVAFVLSSVLATPQQRDLAAGAVLRRAGRQ